jgi:hypothetical protein
MKLTLATNKSPRSYPRSLDQVVPELHLCKVTLSTVAHDSGLRHDCYTYMFSIENLTLLRLTGNLDEFAPLGLLEGFQINAVWSYLRMSHLMGKASMKMSHLASPTQGNASPTLTVR